MSQNEKPPPTLCSEPLTRSEIEAMISARLEKARADWEKSAFPEGDAKAHKVYHLSQIEAAAERKAFVKDMFKKTLQGISWFLLLTTSAALWEYFKREAVK